MAIVIGSTSAGTLGTVTLAEVKSIIQAHGYGTDTASQQTTAIRFALRELYGQRRWRFLQVENTTFNATVANDGVVDISTIGRGIMLDSVRLNPGLGATDYLELDWKDDVALASKRWTDRAPGTPLQWARRADTLMLWPRPDRTYQLQVVGQALTTLPSADGDSIQWPETHIAVVVWSAIMVLTWRQRDANFRDRAKQELADALVRLMRDEEFEERQTDLEVGHWDGWAKGGVGLP